MFKFLATLLGFAIAPKAIIEQQLKNSLLANNAANVVLVFQKNDDIIKNVNNMKFNNRADKMTFLKSNLQEHSALSQDNAIQFLNDNGIPFKSMWINNSIPIENPILGSTDSPQISWGINKINAPTSIDTGVLGSHEALVGNFLGDYGWYDPSTKTKTPIDLNGHGTHTMGTIAGSKGIGVAPGCKWMSCLGCPGGSCPENNLVDCGEFIACPCPTDGSSSCDCSKAPHVVSNSWGGGQGETFYKEVIDVWHAVDIIPVFANGNSGPACKSANSFGDSFDVIAVGSTTFSDDCSSFSSRGPTLSGLIKPDVSAPGSDVRSAWNTGDNQYKSISGTSMATPHVAGTIALMLSRNPQLKYTKIKEILQNNAVRGQNNFNECGENGVPSNSFGFGRIDALQGLDSNFRGAVIPSQLVVT